MKLRSKLLTVAAVTVTGLAAAVLPMTVSNAAEACAAAWNASQVYVGGNVASLSGHNYRAKWWNQNESPATHSGQWDVWADQGACGGTTPPTTPPPTDPPPSNGTKMPAAPYIYPGWGAQPDIAALMGSGVGVRSFTIAFVLASYSCNAVWDGESGLTGGNHAATINAIKSRGGTVIPSFGGWQGAKLGTYCTTAQSLADQYMRVIDTFGLQAIDIDIENTDEFENYAVADRIVDALKIVKQRKPGVTTILTFGTTPSGPNVHGIRLINQVKAKNAGVDIFTQMPFDFGGQGNMYNATVGATEGLKNQLKSTFGWTDAQAYSHIGISGMNGVSDVGEQTTPAIWQQIVSYAKSRGLSRLAYWAANRDRQCPGGATGELSSDCSGVAQNLWQFSSISAGF